MKTKIKIHLKQKGIMEKLITKNFDEIDEDDYVKTIQRLYENYESQAYQKSTTIKYLLSRGFEYDKINDTFDKL